MFEWGNDSHYRATMTPEEEAAYDERLRKKQQERWEEEDKLKAEEFVRIAKHLPDGFLKRLL